MNAAQIAAALDGARRERRGWRCRFMVTFVNEPRRPTGRASVAGGTFAPEKKYQASVSENERFQP
jgi:hypothetical protein